MFENKKLKTNIQSKIKSKPKPKKIKSKQNKQNISKMKIITKNVSEPWFSLIKLGIKSVEGRLNKGDFKDLRIDDIIIWTNDDLGFYREFKTKIIHKKNYDTFEDYLLNEGLDKCLPGIENIEDGLKVYFKYYTKQQEKEFGILVLELQKINN